MTGLLSRSAALRYDPLVQAKQQVAEAEERRDKQIRFLTGLTEGTPSRALAQHVLGEIERTVVLSRMHLELIQHLLG